MTVKLNKRVKLQRQSTTVDGAGQPVKAWADVATVWADVRHVSGIEAAKADSDRSEVKASIRIRSRSDVDAGMRVVYSGLEYEIVAVLPDSDRQYVDLVAKRLQ